MTAGPGRRESDPVPGATGVPQQAISVRRDLRRLLLDGVPIIDVRAPIEFERGAVPAAVNLPLMNDEERHQVGLRYKQAGQDKAIELGAQLVDAQARQTRTAAWAAYADAHPDAVLCCFRGGLRSRIAQAWLAETGTVRPLVDGGFKALRQYLIDELERLCAQPRFTLLAGRTGTGKTLLLRQLARHIDLEGIARHRGSSFGGLGTEQPGPIDVENRIAIELMRLDAAVPDSATDVARRVWLEDEAKLIGRVCLPLPLRDAMASAPAVVLETPMEQRIATCFDDYVRDLLARYRQGRSPDAAFDVFAEHHRGSLMRIRKRLGGVRHAHAVQLLEAALHAHREHGDTSGYGAGIELLLTHYYDPMYDYQLSQKRRRILFRGDAQAILSWSTDGEAVALP